MVGHSFGVQTLDGDSESAERAGLRYPADGCYLERNHRPNLTLTENLPILNETNRLIRTSHQDYCTSTTLLLVCSSTAYAERSTGRRLGLRDLLSW